MTTKIRSTFSDSSAVLVILPVGGRTDVVTVRVTNLHTTATAAVTRADLLAAVEAECGVRMVPADAIVIDRAELPVVQRASANVISFADGTYLEIEGRDARWDAQRWLALIEYQDAHPPVDEAQVEALAGLLRDADPTGAAFLSTVADRLLATGRVSVTHE